PPKGQPKAAHLDPEQLASLRQVLIVKTRDDPDFWSVVGLTELRMYESLAAGRLSQERAGIELDYDALRARMPSAPKWKSVLDQVTFVLAGTLTRGSPSEREAAAGLIAHLQAYVDASD
ncbi:MAG: hypothetical protein QFE16_16625, partial [Pseudomonadota bacterium]|nr:hypothetical protein [Pseudomonadota bacterium]